MSKFFTFNELDKKLWIGIAIFGAIFIVLLSVFTTSSPFYYLERLVITLFEMFLPGYVIMKLFLDHVEFTEYKVIDKFLVSFGLSICTVQTLYFLSTYLRTYAFNVDEDVISSNAIAVFIALLVMSGAFGAKYYLLKKGAKTE
ncbi:MAG: hypothetical protein H6R26_718 [Proteobacteria bacterium]|nr:hypothetical protein [Pseudomonadota bacterium]